MILASSNTWRETTPCIACRKLSTSRSSAGIARTSTTPDSAFTITLRPSAVPMIARTPLARSPQKLSSVVVSIWLLCRFCVVTLCGPVVAVVAPDCVEPAESEMAPELTRSSLLPLRWLNR